MSSKREEGREIFQRGKVQSPGSCPWMGDQWIRKRESETTLKEWVLSLGPTKVGYCSSTDRSTYPTLKQSRVSSMHNLFIPVPTDTSTGVGGRSLFPDLQSQIDSTNLVYGRSSVTSIPSNVSVSNVVSPVYESSFMFKDLSLVRSLPSRPQTHSLRNLISVIDVLLNISSWS